MFRGKCIVQSYLPMSLEPSRSTNDILMCFQFYDGTVDMWYEHFIWLFLGETWLDGIDDIFFLGDDVS